MDTQRRSEPAVAERKLDHMVTITQSDVSSVRPDSSHKWSEGRRRFLQLHQERYLQRLVILREALLRDKDFVHLRLPNNCDKNTGFWEAIMDDMENSSAKHKFPNTKSQRQQQASVGGSLSDEQNRRGHLERLRRIRIMQMRRRLPPQLEPLHGIGLGNKNDQRTRENKQVQRVPPTTYHVDWMKGNHIITPIGDREKVISSWTLKHLRTVDAVPQNEVANNFPNDIRELLRQTRHSANSATALGNDDEVQQTAIKTVTSSSVRTRTHVTRKSSHSTISTFKDSVPTLPSPRRSEAQTKEQNIPPPAPASSPSPFMSEIVSHHSSKSSHVSTACKLEAVEYEQGTDADDHEAELVDKASSPVGFRLPPLQQEKRESISSSANSKRHIVVKIPHEAK